MARGRGGSFKGRHFTSEVILWTLRWCLAFPVSYRDLAAMLGDRGVVVDHTPLFRGMQAYAATLERRVRKRLRPCTGSCRWTKPTSRFGARGPACVVRSTVWAGVVDFHLSTRRDTAVAKCSFRKAMRQLHAVNPYTIIVDKNTAYPRAVRELKRAGRLWRF